MTAEQLQHARAAAWRQEGNALLTADDAASWLREVGLALFLPRTAQIAAPSGSFVEATAGESNATPKAAAIENATGILRRLLASGDALALNLLGIPGDQPDFLATKETLPFVFALRGDREWTRGPRGKSSPLVVEVWKLLSREGALSAEEVKDKMGRHLTESAALRAISELWTSLRIEPVYSEGEGTHWQLLEANHEKSMIAGSAMAQGMALSALVSLYLQSVIAATGDEIEAFLSSLASRSRIRDAVRGLTATRQLGVRNLGPHEHFFVEGGLPDFAEAAPAEIRAAIPDMLPEVSAPADIVVSSPAGAFRIEALSEAETEQERSIGEGRKRFVAQRTSSGGERKSFGSRPSRPSSRPPARPDGERKTFSRGSGSGSGRDARQGGPREGDARGGQGTKKPFFAREPWKEDRPSRPAADRGAPGADSGERRPFRPAVEGRSFAPRGDRKPFSDGGAKPFRRDNERSAPGGASANRPFRKEGSDRKPFASDSGARSGSEGDARPFRKPFAPHEGGRPFSGGDRKPFAPREGGRSFSVGGDRKPFAPREGGRPSSSGEDRKPSTPREGTRPFSGSGDRRPFAPREGARSFPSSGDRKSFAPREGGRPPGGDRKPFTPREGVRPFSGGSDRKPFAPREGDGPPRRPFKPRDAEGPARSFSPRAGGTGRPFRRETSEGGAGENSPRRTGRPPEESQRFSSEGGRPARPGTSRTFGAAGGAAKPGGKRPRTSPFTSTGKPRTGAGNTSRPGPRSARPTKPGGGPRKPGAGPRKPGGKGPRRDG